MGYFNIEGDEGHRIGTCDECGSYIRTRFAGEGDNAPTSTVGILFIIEERKAVRNPVPSVAAHIKSGRIWAFIASS